MRLLLLSFFLLTALCVEAQPLRGDTLPPKTTFVRFNALQLIDFENPILSFGGEYRIRRKWSAALDIGYVFSTGVLLRPAIRFFPKGKHFFLEAELHYKLVNSHMNDWLGRDVVDGVPSYEEYKTFTLRKTEIGPSIKAGRLVQLSKKIWVEFYMGLGVRFRKYSVPGHPEY